jgi:hypothetical protein
MAQKKGSSKDSVETLFDELLQETLSKLFNKYCPPLVNLICVSQMPNGEYIKRLNMLVPMTDLNKMCTQLCTCDTLKEQEPLGLGGWFVSDDHTSVQWSRRANVPQQQIGEPYLLIDK